MKQFSGKIIDILSNATAAKLGNKCYDLLYAHALSGCDTVSYPFGKGKKSVLSLMGDVDVHWRYSQKLQLSMNGWRLEWISCLIILCCQEAVEPLSDLRYRLLINKVLQRLKLCHQLQNVQQHMSSVHVSQSCFGCADIAPKSVLQLVTCGCESTAPCTGSTCSCLASGLLCTTLPV